jgi:methylmalonyl-CoA/ethylmalonyl-CoA epimerase
MQYVTALLRRGDADPSMISHVTNTPQALAATLGTLLVRLDHVGIAVDDLDTAVAQWSALGWREVHREVNADEGVWESMLDAPGGGAQLQLLASTSDDSPISRFIDTRGTGIQQVAFEVTDVAAAIEACLVAGLEVLYKVPRRGTSGRDITFIHPRSCAGVLVELIGPAI